MKTIRILALGGALSLLAGPALAAFDLGEAARLGSSMLGGESQGQAAQAVKLVTTLDELGITPQQAIGGTGALLNVARSQLPASQYGELVSEVPGLQRLAGSEGLDQLAGLSGLLGTSPSSAPISEATQTALDNVSTLPQAQQAFSMLGMDSALIGQFAPLLLQYLGNQGIGGPLLQGLANVWGVNGN